MGWGGGGLRWEGGREGGKGTHHHSSPIIPPPLAIPPFHPPFHQSLDLFTHTPVLNIYSCFGVGGYIDK